MILRSIQIAAKELKIKKIRNVYIEMDNVSSNKCFTVVAAMAALCMLGVVKKVKISYLEVGHTHDDYDAIIGTIGSYISRLDLATFEDYKAACIEAITKNGSLVLAVEKIIGITDYDRLFQDFNSSKVKGASLQIRMFLRWYIHYAFQQA
jgi:hypothetical protein